MYQYKDFLQLHTNTAILFRCFDTADADSISKMFPASNLLQVPDIWYEKTISIDLVILLRQIHRHCISPLSLALTFELEKCAFKFVNIF